MRRRRRASPRAGTSQPVDVLIESLGGRGDGIAEYGGRRLYVPHTVPGDRVRVARGPPRADGDRARLEALLTPGPDRRPPACPHFHDPDRPRERAVCGGCDLQHLAPDAYDAFKVRRIETALVARGLADVLMAPAVLVPPGSRRRVVFAVAWKGRVPRMGFRARDSHQIVGVERCPVLDPRLEALLMPLEAALPRIDSGRRGGTVSLLLTQAGADAVLAFADHPGLESREYLVRLAEDLDLARLSWRSSGDEAEPIVVRRPPVLRWGGVAVTPPADAFVQPTVAGEAALATFLRQAVEDLGMDRPRLADLFAGLGALGLSVRDRATVCAVEGSAAMTGALEAAVRSAGIAGAVRVETRDLERAPLAGDELRAFDVALFDPPRAGAMAQARALAADGPAVVVGASCNPATFARDARILVDGGYCLERVQPVDQFTWSHHVELVGLFRRRR